jgi:nickel-type superoxide dismutase maturation protease
VVKGLSSRLPFGLVGVYGPSMAPTLLNGDALLVQYGAAVRPGHVVVLRHPFQQDLLVVKRAVERRAAGWWVLGDSPYAGGDSTDYGAVPDELVLAVVRLRLRPRDPHAPAGQRPAPLSWADRLSRLWSAVRPVPCDASASRRLRAR